MYVYMHRADMAAHRHLLQYMQLGKCLDIGMSDTWHLHWKTGSRSGDQSEKYGASLRCTTVVLLPGIAGHRILEPARTTTR